MSRFLRAFHLLKSSDHLLPIGRSHGGIGCCHIPCQVLSFPTSSSSSPVIASISSRGGRRRDRGSIRRMSWFLDCHEHTDAGISQTRDIFDKTLAEFTPKGIQSNLFLAPIAGFFLGRRADLFLPDIMDGYGFGMRRGGHNEFRPMLGNGGRCW